MTESRIGKGAGGFDAYDYARLCQHLGRSAMYRRDENRSVTAELFDECEAFERDFARAGHADKAALCESLAGHYLALTDIAPFLDAGANGMTRDAYIGAALSAKGLGMDLEGLPEDSGPAELAAEMASRLEIRDREVASAWLADLGDGAGRDAYGRKRNPETGRPDAREYPSLAYAYPGGYVRRMQEDCARIERKREAAWRGACRSMGQDVPDYAPPEQAAPKAPEPPAEPPKKQGAFARLMGVLRREDAGPAPERGGPEY